MSAEPKGSSSELQAPPYESSPPTGRPDGLHSRKGYQALPQEEEEEPVEPQEAQPELVPQSGAYPPLQPHIPGQTERYIPGPYPAYSALTPPTAGYPPTQPVPPLGYPPPPPVPQGGYPTHYQARGYDSMSSPRPPPGYIPAPPVLQQQQQSSNVVVLNQPAAPQMTTEVTFHSHPNDYLVLTIVMMVLCGLHLNLLAFLFLIPALCFAFAASSHKDAGNYSRASSFGRAALCFNIMAMVYFILLIIVVVVLTALFLSPA